MTSSTPINRAVAARVSLAWAESRKILRCISSPAAQPVTVTPVIVASLVCSVVPFAASVTVEAVLNEGSSVSASATQMVWIYQTTLPVVAEVSHLILASMFPVQVVGSL